MRGMRPKATLDRQLAKATPPRRTPLPRSPRAPNPSPPTEYRMRRFVTCTLLQVGVLALPEHLR